MKKNKWRYKVSKHYSGMHSRCYNPKDKGYKNYGARGITVCDRWRGEDGMLHFYEDMGTPPIDKTLDRVNNNGPYSPDNCRWATRKEQNRNTRRNHVVTIKGKEMCLIEAIEESGLSLDTVKQRIRKGMSEEEALTVPLHTHWFKRKNK